MYLLASKLYEVADAIITERRIRKDFSDGDAEAPLYLFHAFYNLEMIFCRFITTVWTTRQSLHQERP